MSRLDTQQDRLVRGPSGNEQQRSFLAQPQRFAVGNQTKVSEIVASIAQSAGYIAGIKEERETKTAKLAKELKDKQFNEYFVELKRKEDLYNSEPTSYNREQFLAHRTDGFATFGNDSDYAVTIETRSISSPDIRSMEQETQKKVEKERQGGYQGIIDNTISRLVNDPQVIEMLATKSYDETQDYLTREVLAAFPEDIEFSQATVLHLGAKLNMHANGGEIKKRRDELQELAETNSRNAAERNMYSEVYNAGSPEEVAQVLYDYARDQDLPEEEVVGDAVEHGIANLESSVMSGTPQQIRAAQAYLDNLGPYLNAIQASQVVSAKKNIGALEGNAATSAMSSFAERAFRDSAPREEVNGVLNDLGVDAFNNRFGTDYAGVGYQNLESIPTSNEVEETFKQALISGRDTTIKRYDEKKDALVKGVSVFNNPNDASLSDVKSLVTQSPEERALLLDVAIDQVSDSLVGVEDVDERRELASLIPLLEDAKNDPAAWASVLSAQTEDTRHYRAVFNEVVKENLSGPPYSQDGLRAALAFVDNDTDTVSTLMDGDYRSIYALSGLMRHTLNNPNEENLSGVYTALLTEYDSVKFKSTDGDKAGVSLGQALTTPKFAAKFTGQSRAQISPETASKLVAILDIGAIDMSDSNPSAAGARTAELLKGAGYFLLNREVGDSVVSTVHRIGSNTPESVGYKTSTLEKDLLTPDSQASLFFSQMLTGQEGGPKNIQSLITRAVIDSGTVREELAEYVRDDVIQANIDSGRVRLHVATEVATEMGTPVSVVLSRKDGQPPTTIFLGVIDFQNLPPQAESKNFFKSRGGSSRLEPTFRPGALGQSKL